MVINMSSQEYLCIQDLRCPVDVGKIFFFASLRSPVKFHAKNLFADYKKLKFSLNCSAFVGECIHPKILEALVSFVDKHTTNATESVLYGYPKSSHYYQATLQGFKHFERIVDLREAEVGDLILYNEKVYRRDQKYYGHIAIITQRIQKDATHLVLNSMGVTERGLSLEMWQIQHAQGISKSIIRYAGGYQPLNLRVSADLMVIRVKF
jgi:hypothetical protein